MIAELSATLTDPVTKDSVLVKIRLQEGGVGIAVEGYGDFGSTDGEGEPIYVEYYNGKLVAHLWADINKEDPTHSVELEGALEGNRQEVSS